MNWIVLKYGGSSITKKGFKSIDKRINELKDKFKIVIVLSAKKNVTNFLVNHDIESAKEIYMNFMLELKFDTTLINQILALINTSNHRELISKGELIATTILYNYIKCQKHMV